MFHYFVVGLYATNFDEPIFLLKGQHGGITQLKFTTDGFFLFAGGRKVCQETNFHFEDNLQFNMDGD